MNLGNRSTLRVREVAGRLTLEVGKVATQFTYDKAYPRGNGEFVVAEESPVVN